MKKLLALTKRNLLEMLRDPLTTVFCLLFPVVMLVFMQLIIGSQESMPENFQIEHYAPGICVFGYGFTSMFMAMSIASDKNSSFIKRIVISPIRKTTYLLSFLLSGLLIVLIQTVFFFAIALFFNFPFDGRIFLSIAYLVPSSLFFLSFGIMLGSLCKHEKQTGPINSIVISLTGILGGVFMPLSAFSGAFATIVDILPFAHAVLIASEIYSVGASCIYPHILYLIGYTTVIWGIVALLEKHKK